MMDMRAKQSALRTVSSLAMIVAVAGTAGTARASETAQPQAQPDTGNQAEIVVTAQKREQKTKDTPLAITAISGGQLEAQQATNLVDYVKDVPGMAIIGNGQPGRDQVVLRGVTTGPGEPLPQVAAYLDEIPYGFTNAYTLPNNFNLDSNLFDIQRVEVLKGPQGTLYGSAAMGGLIKVVTNPPNLDHTSAHVLAGLSSTDHGDLSYEAKAAVNVSLIPDRLALRLVGYDQHDGGFIDNVFNGEKDINHDRLYGGRAALRWQATDALRIDLNAHWDHIDDNAPASVDANPSTGALLYGRYKANVVVPEHDVQDIKAYSGVISWSPSWFTLTSATSYTTRTATTVTDASDEVQPVFPSAKLVGIVDPGRRFTEELRIASRSGGRVEWLAGAYYNHESVTMQQSLSFATFPPSLADNLPSKYREIAGFGNITFKFNKHFDVTGGIRLSEFSQSVIQNLTLAPPLVPAVFSESPPAAKMDGSDTTYSVSARWRPTDELTGYLRFSQGFNPGGVNIPEPPDPKVDPERLNNYEAGAKLELFDHRLRMDLSVYKIDWSNIVVTGSRADQTAFVINGGKAAGHGIEFQGSWTPGDGFAFTFNADRAYTRFRDAIPLLNVASGSRFAGVPKGTFAVGAEKSFQVGADFRNTFGVNVSYVGNSLSNYTAVAGEQVVVPAYTNVDLRDRLSFGRYKVDLYVKNLFDKQEITNIRTDNFILAAPPFATVSHLYVGRPRTLGITVSADF